MPKTTNAYILDGENAHPTKVWWRISTAKLAEQPTLARKALVLLRDTLDEMPISETEKIRFPFQLGANRWGFFVHSFPEWQSGYNFFPVLVGDWDKDTIRSVYRNFHGPYLSEDCPEWHDYGPMSKTKHTHLANIVLGTLGLPLLPIPRKGHKWPNDTDLGLELVDDCEIGDPENVREIGVG